MNADQKKTVMKFAVSSLKAFVQFFFLALSVSAVLYLEAVYKMG